MKKEFKYVMNIGVVTEELLGKQYLLSSTRDINENIVSQLMTEMTDELSVKSIRAKDDFNEIVSTHFRSLGKSITDVIKENNALFIVEELAEKIYKSEDDSIFEDGNISIELIDKIYAEKDSYWIYFLSDIYSDLLLNDESVEIPITVEKLQKALKDSLKNALIVQEEKGLHYIDAEYPIRLKYNVDSVKKRWEENQNLQIVSFEKIEELLSCIDSSFEIEINLNRRIILP